MKSGPMICCPGRIAQDVRAAALGEGLVDDVPDLDLALVTADHGLNMVVHPLEQLLAGGARAAETAATETAATAAASATAGRIRRCRVRGGDGCRWRSVRHPGRQIGPCEDPSGCLAVPDQRVSHDIHVIAHAEVHVSVGRAKIVSARSLLWMDHFPLQVVLRGNLVELVCDDSNVFIDLIQGLVDVVGPDRGASRDGAVDGHANVERTFMFVGVLKRGRRFGHTAGQRAGKQQGGYGKGGRNGCDSSYHV